MRLRIGRNPPSFTAFFDFNFQNTGNVGIGVGLGVGSGLKYRVDFKQATQH
jgi:hypothetical protein